MNQLWKIGWVGAATGHRAEMAESESHGVKTGSLDQPSFKLVDALRKGVVILSALAGCAVLVFLARRNYLLFHCLVEISSVAVAWGLFLLVWNVRRYLENKALLLLGTAYAFVGVFDLLHTLTYRGMGVLTWQDGANLPTQLWIAARTIEMAGLVFYAASIARKPPIRAGVVFFFVLSGVLLLSLFVWDVFPTCYVEGSGLTPFKKGAEYGICAGLLAALVLLYRKRRRLDAMVFRLLFTSVVVFLLSELCFTLYIDVYGTLNAVGHLLKTLSYILVFAALIHSGIRRPYALLFRELGERDLALRESNQRQRTILNSVPDLVVMQDLDHRISWANASALEYLGVSLEEASSVRCWDLHGGKREACADCPVERALRTGRVEEGSLQMPNGAMWYVRACPIVDEEGRTTQILEIAQDITERVNSQAEYAGIIQTATDGFWSTDIEGRILDVNDAAAEMLGYTADELRALTICDVEAIETPAETAQHIAELVQHRYGRFESRHRKKDGAVIDVDISCSYMPIAGGRINVFVRDITERKRAERALRDSQELFSKTFFHAPVLMWISSTVDGRLHDVNAEFERVTGFAKEQCVDRTLADIGIMAAGDQVRFESALNATGHVAGMEFELRRANGARLCCQYWGERIEAAGEVRLLSIANDITHEKEREYEREITNDLLRLLTQSNDLHGLMRDVTRLMQECSGCEAVGIRLEEQEDFPYFETRGFPPEFVEAERHLCALDEKGELLRDSRGNPVLECMCGNVICGRFDPALPFFTGYGTFWTNSTSELLATTNEADRQARTRNRCHGEGYESVALVPLRHGVKNLGLLQLNDRSRDKFTPEKIRLLERLASNVAMGLAHRSAQRALHESEARFRGVFEVSPTGIAVADIGTQRFVQANQSFLDIVGYSHDELTGLTVQDITHPDDVEEEIKAIRAYLAGETPVFRLHKRYLCKDGGVRTVLVHGEVLESADGGSELAIANVVDITEQIRTEAALERHTRLLEAIRECQNLYITGGAHSSVFERILATMTRLGESEFGFLDEVLYDEDGTPYKLSLALADTHWDDESKALYEQLRQRNLQFRNLNNLAGAPVLSGKTVISNDAANDPLSGGRPHGHPELRAFMGIPLFFGGKIVGVMGLANRAGGYDEEVAALLEPLARSCAAIIYSVRQATERQHSAALYRSIVDAAQEGLWMLDGKGNTVFVNSRVTDILGYSTEEVIGHHFSEFVDDANAAGAREDFEKALQGPIGRREMQLRRKDGTLAWVILSTTPIREESGKLHGVLGTVTDMSGRKVVEDALRESEGRYRSFVEHTTEGVYMLVLDAAIDISLPVEDQVNAIYDNASIAECNDAFAQMYGLQYGDDLIERRLVDFHEGRENPVNRAELRRFVASGYSVHAAETLETNALGESRWFSNSSVGIVQEGRLTHIWGTQIDITERRKAERERERLISAIDQAAEIVVVTDAEGVIHYVNPAFESITGYPLEEAIGNTPRILKSGKHDDAFYADLWRRISSGEIWQGQIINKRKDGSYYTTEASISAVRDENGKIVDFVGVMRDITAEVELGESLRQAQKMEAIGTLAGGIAHDFNNILAAMIGYAELIRESSPEGDADLARYTEELLKGGERARELIDQILTFSRRSEPDRRPLSLGALTKECAKMLRAVLPTSIHLVVEIADSAGADTVLADVTQMHQVIMNLCTNAWQAMREQPGTLFLSVAPVEVTDITECPGLNPGPHVRLRVRDTGRGIPEDNLSRIFEPFFTTKEPGEGTGMGLSVVHGVVRNHGGSIMVQSEEGGGTVFDVFIPRVSRPVETLESPQPRELPRGTERILLVDDEDALLSVMSKMMLSLGYHVTTRRNGMEALELFHEDPDQFDLVMTDLTMPLATGVDLAQGIVAVRPELPILLCTGYGEKATRGSVQSAVFQEILKKPLTKRELAHALRRVLERRTGSQGGA